MIVLSVILVTLATFLIQEAGEFTQNTVRKLAAIAVFIASGIFLSNEYGTLRGVFITIGLISLIGTLFTLLRYKFSDGKST